MLKLLAERGQDFIEKYGGLNEDFRVQNIWFLVENISAGWSSAKQRFNENKKFDKSSILYNIYVQIVDFRY